MTVYDGIARHLAAAGIGLTYRDDGTPYAKTEAGITLLAVPDKPDLLVVLGPYPGPEDDDRNSWRMPRLQVRVRGTTDPRTAMKLDHDCSQVLHALGPVTLTDADSTRLTDCYALQASGQSLGQDAQGRWEMTRNYQLTLAN